MSGQCESHKDLNDRLTRIEDKLDAVIRWQHIKIGEQKSNAKWTGIISAGISIVVSALISVWAKKL